MPRYLNTAEAMKNGCNRQTESACCGDEAAVDDSTLVSKMFAQRTQHGACHVPSGAYTLMAMKEKATINIRRKRKAKNKQRRPSKQQQEDHQQHSALRKVLSFTPV
jgi:adenylate kinase family enzyme